MSEDVNMQENPANTPNDLEALAREHGWKPNGPKSAKEYVQFALENLPKKNAALDIQNRSLHDKDQKITEMEIILGQLADDMQKQKDLAYRQAEADINARRNAAINQGNVNAVAAIDQEKEALQKEKGNIKDLKGLQEEAYNKVLIDNFRENNASWIQDTSMQGLRMQAYARQLEAAMNAQGIPLKDQLANLDKAVREEYPTYFEVPEEYIDSGVESVQQETNVMRKPKKSYTIKDLTEAQRYAANYLANRGTMTVEAYIQKLVDAGDL